MKAKFHVLWLTYCLRLSRLFRRWAEALEEQSPEYVEAMKLAMSWREDRTVSGEYKRYRIYADLQKRYPAMKKQHLGLLIERVVAALP